MADLDDVAALFGNYSIPESMTEEEIDKALEFLNEQESLECECGSEKIYGESASHSSWCPKHDD